MPYSDLTTVELLCGCIFFLFECYFLTVEQLDRKPMEVSEDLVCRVKLSLES